MTDLRSRLGWFITELRSPDDTVGISPSSEYAEGWVDAQEDAADRLSAILDEHETNGVTYVVAGPDDTHGVRSVHYAGADADAAKQAYDRVIDESETPRVSTTTVIEVWEDGEQQFTTMQHPELTPQLTEGANVGD